MAAQPLAAVPHVARVRRAQSWLAGRAAVWLRRYLPSELAGTLAGLLCAGVSAHLGGGRATVAVAYTWGECLAYYGLIIARGLRRRGAHALPSILRELALEFGPAELLDGLLLRPAALFAGLTLAARPAVGLAAGKLCADIMFYLPAILSYELLRRARPEVEDLPHDR
jgi:hypothetical protein